MGSLHPALVHLPIGLLFGYSVVELFVFFFPRFRSKFEWGKYLMLMLGFVGGIFAFQSGEALEDKHPNSPILEMHELFASATMWVYAIVAAILTVLVLDEWDVWKDMLKRLGFMGRLWEVLVSICLLLHRPWILALLSVAGLLALNLSGAFGGMLVHGVDADWMTRFVHDLFL